MIGCNNTISPAEAIYDLDEMSGRDFEKLHCEADKILLAVLNYLGHEDVTDAYLRAEKRLGFVCS